ncbi:MAG: universal stress protein [Desulfobacteraceae bacterium]|nr:universal stress protein [Desulfobacteraceae bacterium]
MNKKLLHIFRNTPFGRETFLQSLYFCKMTKVTPIVYIPKTTKFLMYFAQDAVQIDLDNSYLTSPESAVEHVTQLFGLHNFKPLFFEPKNYTASTLPDIPTNFDFVCLPRSISDLSSKIGLGHLGPKVRRIVKTAGFPTLITSPVFKKWKSIAVFFGGSTNAVKAAKLGARIGEISDLPVKLYTIKEKDENYYRTLLTKSGLENKFNTDADSWHFLENNAFEESLYEIPHNALIILGAFGHGVIKDVLFGSKMEKIQSTLTNNMLIVGPNCTIPRFSSS